MIDHEQCTHAAGATPFLEQILAAAKRRGTRLPSLRLFMCGGASVPPSLVREATAWFANCIVTRVYGSTEVPTITTGSVRPGDIGHAAETDGEIGYAAVKITDGMGGEGEIWARGPQMLVGYLHAEDEREAFDADGFFRTGDIGRIEDERFLVISGRKKDIIIRHGENISPKEIEDFLILHPDIAEIAIVGIPNARTGEIACAFVVPRPGADITAKTLSDFLSARAVARYKYPERVELRDSLPRNAAGKILKHQLRSELVASGRV
jgi:acyl-CoA synthetase (AMP-forming)/AMP-acid ligase II